MTNAPPPASFSRAMGLLARRSWLVAGCALLGGLPALVFSLMMPRVYEARTSLIVVESSLGDAAARGLPVAVANVRALLENRGLAQQIIKEFAIAGMTPDQFVLDVLRVERVRDTNQLQVFVRLGDPQKAANVANRLVELGANLNRQLSSKEVVATRDFLKTQVDDAQGRLDSLQKRLVEFKSTEQVELLRRDTSVMMDLRGELLRLNADIEAERAKLAQAQQELNRHSPGEGGAASGSNSLLAWSQRRQASNAPPSTLVVPPRENEMAAPSAAGAAGAAPNTPIVDEVPPSLENASNPVRAVLDYEVSSSRSKLASLERRREELVKGRQVNAARYEKLSKMYDVDLEISRLQLEYDLAKDVYSDVSKRYEQARVMELGRSSNLHLADAATVPTVPVAPRTKMNVAIGLALGLACGMAWALRGLTGSVEP